MQLHLADTLKYDGRQYDYSRSYFPKGLMNQATRVYEAQDGSTIHYRPDTGLKRYVGPLGESHRVEVDSRDDEAVQIRDSEHRGY